MLWGWPFLSFWLCQNFVCPKSPLPGTDRKRTSEMVGKSVHEGKGRKCRCQTRWWRILKKGVSDVFDWSSNCQIIARNLTRQTLSLSLLLLACIRLLPLRMSMCLRLYFFLPPQKSLACTCLGSCSWKPGCFQRVLMCFPDTIGKRRTCDLRRKHVNCRHTPQELSTIFLLMEITWKEQIEN